MPRIHEPQIAPCSCRKGGRRWCGSQLLLLLSALLACLSPRKSSPRASCGRRGAWSRLQPLVSGELQATSFRKVIQFLLFCIVPVLDLRGWVRTGALLGSSCTDPGHDHLHVGGAPAPFHSVGTELIDSSNLELLWDRRASSSSRWATPRAAASSQILRTGPCRPQMSRWPLTEPQLLQDLPAGQCLQAAGRIFGAV